MNKETKLLALPQIIERTGVAPEVQTEKSINISGTLSAPADYLLSKIGSDKIIPVIIHDNEGYSFENEKMYHINQSTLFVDNDNKILCLKLNQKTRVTDVIDGALVPDNIWGQLRINTGQTWNVPDLRKFLKKIKFYFSKPEEHVSFLQHLQNFVAKVESNYNDTHKSGEFENSIQRKLMDGAVIPEFRINAPIFKGYEKKDVRVEVFADVSDGSVKFSLESQDHFTLQEELSEKYIKEEVKRIQKICKDYDSEISVVTLS